MSIPMPVRENIQTAAAKIPPYALLEIYKDNINSNNALGYSILPLEGLTTEAEINAAIRARIASSAPTGYNNLQILAGREINRYDYRIVYCVWYTGSNIPTYPPEPSVSMLPTPSAPLDVWTNISIINTGAHECYCEILLQCIPVEETVDLYLNDDLFSVDINKMSNNFSIKINKDGVFINDQATDAFHILTVPSLKIGTNSLRVKCTNVSNVTVQYTPQY